MKRTLSLVLSLIMILGIFTSMPVTVNAASASDLTFKLNSDGKSYSVDSLQTSIIGTLIIPSTFEGYPVTSIKADAFWNNTSLTSIIIPDSVTSIGNYAFSDCTNLTSITIPDSVTSIGAYAFKNCTSLTSVTIGDSVTYIGSKVFENCIRLRKIYWNAKSVGDFEYYDEVFYNAGSRDLGLEVVFGDTVESIPAYLFYSSISPEVTKVTIGNNVTSIGDYAFKNCTSLTSITISCNVTIMGSSVFYNTGYYNNSSNWKSDVLYVGNHLVHAKNTISDNYGVEIGTKTIAGDAFKNCTNLISITIPDSVTRIGNTAFYKCTSLTSITIPNNVKSIGNETFLSCSNLKYITIPNSVTNIGSRAFYNTALTRTYYCGTKAQWDNISIGDYNEPLYSDIVCNYIPPKISTPKVKAVNTIKGMNVSWNAVDGAVKYGIYKRLGTENTWTFVTTLTGTSYADNDAPLAGKYYVYTVKAYNSAGIASDYIRANCASVQRVVAPVTKAVNAINGVNVTWNKVAGASKYVVLRRIGTESTWKTICTTTSTSYIDKNVKSGTYYLYSIRAVNNTGYSAYDINKRFNIQRVDTPTAVTINLVNGVQVKWGKISGAAKYNVYRRMAGTSTWVHVGTTTGTSLVDKNVVNGKYYAYSIRAINNTGYSAFDTKKTDTIQPITTPTAKVAKKSNGVQVSWNSVSGATKYNVYRRLGGTSTWIYVGTTTSTTLLDKGVVKGKSYAYSIRAINGTGYSAYNSTKCASIKYS